MEDRKRNRLLTGTFLALIFGMTCWSLLKKDTIFSEKEKRYLQQETGVFLGGFKEWKLWERL